VSGLAASNGVALTWHSDVPSASQNLAQMIVTATGYEGEKAKAAPSGIGFAGARAELQPGIRTYHCHTDSSTRPFL
jgi:hypothetical protein